MANIILSVDLESQKATEGLGQLQESVKAIATSLNNITVNNDATRQIEAITEHYKSLSSALKTNYQEEKRKIQLDKEKKKAQEQLRREIEKTRKATAQADLAEEKLTQTRKKSTEETKKSTEVNKKHEKGILEMAAGFLQWQLAATLVMKPLQLVRNAVSDLGETVVEVESDVVSLKRVLKENFADNSEVYGEIFDLAQEYSRHYEEVNEIVQNFARTGMTYAESLEAARGALLGMNVAELEATESSEGLISIMTQFEMEAEDIVSIIDVFNKSADNAAVTTEKLLKALQRTGSSAKNANLDLEQTTGIITALSAATGRSGENLGTALNSLIQYSGKNSALETFAALSDDTAKVVANYRAGAANILDVWRSVSSEIKTLTKEQADSLDAYFNTAEGAELSAELSAELGEVYDELGGVYDTANTFRKNYFIALLNNMDEVDKAIEVARSAQGYSEQENLQYLETYEAKAIELEAKWKEIANDEQGILGFKKVLAEIGMWTLNVMDWTGGLTTTLFAAGTAASALFGAKAIDGIKKFSTWIKTASTGATSLSIGLTAAMGVLTVIVGVVGAVNQYYEELHKSNQEAIEAANANRENIKVLEELEKKYNTLDKTSQEYKDTEEQIISLLGDKGKALEYLKDDQDAYTDSIKRSIEALKEEYALSMRIGYEAAKSELQTHDVGNYGAFGESGLGLDTRSKELAESVGLTAIPEGLVFENSVEAELINYVVFMKRRQELVEALKTLDPGSNASRDIALLIKEFDDQLAIDSEYINDYIDHSAYVFLEEWLDDGNEISAKYFGSQKGILTKYLLEKLGVSGEAIGFYRPIIEDYIDKWFKQNVKPAVDATDDLGDSTEEWGDSLAAAKDKYKDILSELEKLLDKQKEEATLAEKYNAILEATKKLEEARAKARRDAILDTLSEERKEIEEANTLEERRLAIVKARQALEDAKKQRTVRVINASTGTFERVANQADVEEAEKNLSDAIDALNEYIEDQAWDSVIEAVEDGNDDISQILLYLRSTLSNFWGDMSKEERIELEAKIYSALQKGFNAPVDESGINSAQDSLTRAQNAYQDFIDQSLYNAVKDLLGAGEAVTTEQLNEVLKKYEDLGASKEALDIIKSVISKIVSPEAIEAPKSPGYALAEGAIKGIAAVFSPSTEINSLGFPAVASSNGWLYGRSSDNATVHPTSNASENTQINQIFINGVPIPIEQARSMTIEQFCREQSAWPLD